MPATYDELVEQAEETPIDADDDDELADDSPDSPQQMSLF
jgi:hypothetical protein